VPVSVVRQKVTETVYGAQLRRPHTPIHVAVDQAEPVCKTFVQPGISEH